MCLYTTVLMMNEHPDGLLEAKGVIGDEGTSDLSHPSFLPLPPDHGFKSDRSSISTASLMSSQSDCSDGSRHSRQGRRHQEEMHMKINLPIFKDEDAKDAVTYQSWRWGLDSI